MGETRDIPMICGDCGYTTYLKSDVDNEQITVFCDNIKECQARAKEAGRKKPSAHRIFKPTFLKDVEFYCNRCDGRIVHSNKPETGTFYGIYGTVRTGHDIPIGPDNLTKSVQVFWALCPQCDDGSVE